jgi:hypothetical protein
MPGQKVLAAAPNQTECTAALMLLSGQILEGLLKALLLKAGLTEQELKELKKENVRHNLSALWAWAATKGLPVSPTLPDWVETLNGLHNCPFHLRYPKGLLVLVQSNAQQMTSKLEQLIEMVARELG